jgi:DivIVA domain-containing protein
LIVVTLAVIQSLDLAASVTMIFTAALRVQAYRHTGVMGDHQGFTVVLRGYDPEEVDAVLRRVKAALASTDPAMRAAVRTELDQPGFRVRMRGYDRSEVDDYLRKAFDRLA